MAKEKEEGERLYFLLPGGHIFVSGLVWMEKHGRHMGGERMGQYREGGLQRNEKREQRAAPSVDPYCPKQ